MSKTLYLILHRKPKCEWRARSHVFSSKGLAKSMIKCGVARRLWDNIDTVIVKQGD